MGLRPGAERIRMPLCQRSKDMGAMDYHKKNDIGNPKIFDNVNYAKSCQISTYGGRFSAKQNKNRPQQIRVRTVWGLIIARRIHWHSSPLCIPK